MLGTIAQILEEKKVCIEKKTSAASFSICSLWTTHEEVFFFEKNFCLFYVLEYWSYFLKTNLIYVFFNNITFFFLVISALLFS